MPENRKKFQILLVDDHPLVRESLTSLIEMQADLAVCGEAEDGAQAMREIGAKKPDIAIVDISLRDGSGLELVKTMKIRAPDVKVVILSMHDEKLYAERCIRAGARGYVMKRETSNRILSALREVLAGKLAVSNTIAASFAEKFVSGRRGAGDTALAGLSDRELEIFNLLGSGLETRQVAEHLHVSIKTVQSYCARIKQKLHLSTATELMRAAIRWHEQGGSDSSAP